MGPFCLWVDLQPEHLAALDAVQDEEGTRQVLASALRITPEDNPLRHEVLLEFFVNNVRFARENDFSVEKTSTLFSIMKRNHDEMVEAFLPMEKSWEYFKALLLAHSVQRPPHSVGIFSLKEVQLITDFALNTYYRHFKLFRYAFTMRHVKAITTRTCLTELPPTSFPPLLDGVDADMTPEAAEAEEEPAALPEMPEVKLDIDVPDEVKKVVEEQINAQVAAMRAMLEAQYADKFARHEEQIAALETKCRSTCSH